jgi:hypothetical protein
LIYKIALKATKGKLNVKNVVYFINQNLGTSGNLFKQLENEKL